MSATGTATFYFKKICWGGGKFFLGRENSRATPPLYEALKGTVFWKIMPNFGRCIACQDFVTLQLKFTQFV